MSTVGCSKLPEEGKTPEQIALSDPKKAARNSARRIEELVTLDITEWRTEMQRLEERSLV